MTLPARASIPREPSYFGRSRLRLAVTAAAALAISAAVNHLLAERATRKNPPRGRFVEVDGVRLHYIERGQGAPLVLLHGNGSMIQDMESSGLVDLTAETFRVIAFDRPGFGHSTRPTRFLTPHQQAGLLYKALRKLGIESATVLGHSWGASVAVALGLAHPNAVRALVLASGYYYPTPRLDVLAFGFPSLPIIGDIFSQALSPPLTRLIWRRMMRELFGPRPVPQKFAQFPREMALRPSQLRAAAAEAAMMVPDAFTYWGKYSDLKMPVVIVAGEEDRLVASAHAVKLHKEIGQSVLRLIPGHGHMIHQTATGQVLMAIHEAAGVAPRSSQGS